MSGFPLASRGVGVLTHDNEVIRGYYAAFVKILKEVFERSAALKASASKPGSSCTSAR